LVAFILPFKKLIRLNGAESNITKKGAVVNPMLQTDTPIELTIQYGKLDIKSCHATPQYVRIAVRIIMAKIGGAFGFTSSILNPNPPRK
jgi:hypothetical protein